METNESPPTHEEIAPGSIAVLESNNNESISSTNWDSITSSRRVEDVCISSMGTITGLCLAYTISNQRCAFDYGLIACGIVGDILGSITIKDGILEHNTAIANSNPMALESSKKRLSIGTAYCLLGTFTVIAGGLLHNSMCN